MDDQQPTQPSTQPYHDPRRTGINNSGLSDADASDVLCILHPASHLARKAVIAAARSSPQHVLQNANLLEGFETIGEGNDDLLAQHSMHDIALRMSSSLRNPHMGFCFGRNTNGCDIILDEKPISNVHFRIYLNKEGVLMLEDTSSNGTIVDDELLLRKQPSRCPKRRTLVSGSIIKTVTSAANHEARFIVRLPVRDGHQAEHGRKLAQYMAYMDQVDRQHRAIAEAKAKGLWTGEKTDLAKPILRLQDIPDLPLVEPSRYTLGSTSAGYAHGMQWTGGPTYNVVGQIGKGAFATVYKLTMKNDGRVFAAKELDKRRFMKNGILDMKVDNELKIMKGLRHPHIVQYVDYHDHEQWLYIIMEYVPGGELSTFIRENGPMSEVMVKTVARQILHALDYLHRRKITHRDIKPDNVLISSFDPLRVKLSDFGLSKVVNQETFLKTFCGTLLYCAPEVYPEYDRYKRGERKRRRVGDPMPKTSPYSQAVDMWSFGAVLFHILCNDPPYMGRGDDKGAQMLRNIMTMEADFDPLRKCGVSEEGIEFISMLLNRDPMQRPREQACFQHPWIADVPDDEFMEIELDDFVMGDAGLNAIDEGDEEELDASQLNIQDDLGVLDFNTDDEDSSVDELAADHYQSKRARFEDSRVDPGIQEIPASPDVLYPVLSEDNHRPGRLFGEITESALRSSGVLGQNTRVALNITTAGSHDETLNESNFEELPSNDSSVNHYLQYPHTLPIPSSLGGSAPSLLGAEALVGQLQMESPASAYSPVSTPNTNNPVTPETPKTREGSPSRSTHPPPSDTDSTPKVPRLSRQLDFDPNTSHGGELHNSAEQGLEAQLQLDAQDLSHNNGGEGEGGATAVPTRVLEMGPNLNRQPDPYFNPDTINAPSDGDVPRLQGSVCAPATMLESLSQPQSNGFAKPYRCLGKLTSLPGSFIDVKFRLEHRMTSWGRGTGVTIQYPDAMDTRVPKYGLEITFWKPNIEQKIQDNEDWTQIPDVLTIISTKTSKCIWVNDVELRSETPEKDHYYYGKLYTGDIVTVYRGSDKFLKCKVEIHHGLSAMPRPEEEKPFVIETTKAKTGTSSE